MTEEEWIKSAPGIGFTRNRGRLYLDAADVVAFLRHAALAPEANPDIAKGIRLSADALQEVWRA